MAYIYSDLAKSEKKQLSGIATIQLEDEATDKLLSSLESHFFDRKSKRILPSTLSKSLSAFANSDGGELLVGVEDDGTWDGFGMPEDANPIVQILEKHFGFGEYLDAVFLANSNRRGYILKIEIRKSPDIKRSTSGEVYVRKSAQNLKQDEQGIRRLELAKGVISYENEAVRDDLDSVANSATVLEFMLQVIPNAEPIEWLRKQKLIRNNLPTVAGELLFADEPQSCLPKATVKVYRYKTAEAEGTRATLGGDPISIDGPVCKLINDAVQKTVELTEAIPVLGAQGLEKVKYPREAIHEVVSNAVLHRDYSINDDIHVRIFDNRIEVVSPGRLPAHITVENILTERFARNPSIVRWANKFPNAPNKDVGEGLNTTFEVMRQDKFKNPIIRETDGSVAVILLHEKLASYEELIIEYLNQHHQINNSKARDICREGSENKMKRVFEGLMKSNVIKRVEGKRGKATAYELCRQ
jgi:ATP-dependent DNA helicase RecG